MFELQKIFLLVKFFNQILCNKSLKAKISCFFSCFFCLRSEAGMFLKQKDCFVPDFTQAEEIQKSGSTEQASQMEQKFPLTISPGDVFNRTIYIHI